MKSSVAIATAAITELTKATARIGVRSVTTEDRSDVGDAFTRRDTAGTASSRALVMRCCVAASTQLGSGFCV